MPDTSCDTTYIGETARRMSTRIEDQVAEDVRSNYGQTYYRE